MNTYRPSLMPRAMAAIVTIMALAVGTTGIWAQASPAAGASQAQRPSAVDEKQAAAMMAERQKMMANMRAMDQKLNDLVARVDTAKGDTARIDAVTAVIKQLVAQRTQMHSQMEAMQTRMMSHMMEHMMSMQGGMMSGRGQAGAMASMSNCPMMKELSKEAAEPDHSAHHPGK